MSAQTPEIKEIEIRLAEFLHDIDALVLATVDGEGQPEASHVPFVEHGDCFYIFVSELASHTRNLQQSGVGSVMFVESGGDHAFTRKRLTCRCRASVIERDAALFEFVMQLMEDRFGNLVATLRGLGDFHLVQLEPMSGNFVLGFGKAFEVDYSDGRRVRHRNPG